MPKPPGNSTKTPGYSTELQGNGTQPQTNRKKPQRNKNNNGTAAGQSFTRIILEIDAKNHLEKPLSKVL